jgi:tetratricopeptide (TPR) repeat protein
LPSTRAIPGYRNLAAVILARVGQYERSSDLYAELAKEYPTNSKVWLSYGHVLKTEGRLDESVAAYRRAIQQEPTFGEAYWSLANLKTFRFGEGDLAVMRSATDDPSVADSDRVNLHFALGKALEDAASGPALSSTTPKAMRCTGPGNPYDPDQNTARGRHLAAVFSREFFAARAGSGCPEGSPIFIVGMPRSGSTLLEQILASHSAVEGTTELPEMITMARELRSLSEDDDNGSYADVLATMSPEALLELGRSYLERTRVHRKTDRPHFIDKMPNNFVHVALIQLALPNAKIIDARRHPMACCFSNFKQHYARGQRFSYGLEDMGRFYRDYVELMAHFDAVLPGRIHRGVLRAIVDDTEAEVRRRARLLRPAFRAGMPAFLREMSAR